MLNSATTKLRHDTIEMQLVETIRDGVGIAYRQQHNLPEAARTIPDLLIHPGNRTYLCDFSIHAVLPAADYQRCKTRAMAYTPGLTYRIIPSPLSAM